jgi:3-oxoacyl-[acyl-carrier protein] reductase
MARSFIRPPNPALIRLVFLPQDIVLQLCEDRAKARRHRPDPCSADVTAPVLDRSHVQGRENADMTLPLAGRAAVVTGAGRRAGIGFATARRLIRLDASVLVHAWTPYDVARYGERPDEAEAAVAELREDGRAELVQADFADPEAPADVMRTGRAAFGHVDILVVNHTRSSHVPLEELTAEHIDDCLHENVRAALLLIKEFAAQHDGREGGRVILMTSGQHLAPMVGEIAYAVSKGALHQITKTFAEALIDRRITVNTINPGPTDTGWGLAEMEPKPMPLGRWGEPNDAARLIAWLCTDDAQWVTGQVIDSEGGFRRWTT